MSHAFRFPPLDRPRAPPAATPSRESGGAAAARSPGADIAALPETPIAPPLPARVWILPGQSARNLHPPRARSQIIEVLGAYALDVRRQSRRSGSGEVASPDPCALFPGGPPAHLARDPRPSRATCAHSIRRSPDPYSSDAISRGIPSIRASTSVTSAVFSTTGNRSDRFA